MARLVQRCTMIAACMLALTFSACGRQAEPKSEANVQAACAPAAIAAAPPVALAGLLARANDFGGMMRVIIEVKPAAGGPGVAHPSLAATQTAALDTLRKEGVPHAEKLTATLPYVVAEMSAAQVEKLYADPHFGVWSEDRIARVGLTASTQLVQAPRLWAIGGRGAGQSVAILDTGVDANYPFLKNAVVAEACFSTSSAVSGSVSACPNGQSSQIGAGAAKPCNADGCEHGTHVAGIAAGRTDPYSGGVAPEAGVVAVQVFSIFSGAGCAGGPSPCVASFTSDQIRALDYVLTLAKQRPIAAVNMSLGGGRATGYCDEDLTKPVIDDLRAAGIATVIAAGNEGYRDAVSYPGCISTAVTIGATTKQDKLASFSNCGPQVDLHAPGVGIVSSVPGGTFAASSGTSMAAPHVAGAFAALRSARPNASVTAIEASLKSTGPDVGGRPRIALFDAAQSLGATQVGELAVADLKDKTPPMAVTALANLPEGKPARFIVRAKPGPGNEAALKRAEDAARKAGASVSRMGGQPLLAIEATPAQVRRLAKSGAVSAIQADRAARPN